MLQLQNKMTLTSCESMSVGGCQGRLEAKRLPTVPVSALSCR